MKDLLKFLAAVFSAFAGERPRHDPLADFGPRDWADLPTYHPLVDSDSKAGC